ncbi:uncharacterized protein [Ptychodera flava]|uniref:uncharacterized protein n=1 Tax=Ptychodera flava TaxID=63121 RepID=UPI00396A28FF
MHQRKIKVRASEGLQYCNLEDSGCGVSGRPSSVRKALLFFKTCNIHTTLRRYNEDQTATALLKLKRSRRGQRAQVTRLFNRADALMKKFGDVDTDQVTTLDTLEALNDQLSSKIPLLADLEIKILDLTDEDHFDEENEASGDYQAEIYERNHGIATFVKKNRPETQTPNDFITTQNGNMSSLGNTQRKTVALPKLRLQTFSGNVLEWSTFFDVFKSSVHSDSNLGNIQKFTYLRSMLKDEAARTVSGLSLNEANYSHAIDLLKERYGQTHLIVDAHMTALWNLQKPTNDAQSLRNFFDSIESHVRGLQSLGKEERTYGELLVPLIREKLPQNIRKQIARDHGNSAWTLSELRQAILHEINALQAGKPIDEMPTSNGLIEITAAFHTTAQSPNRQKSRTAPKTCPFCKGSHFASNCSVITDTRQRLDIIKKDRLCFYCFGRHRVSECKSRYSCKKSKKRHHTALHRDDVAVATSTTMDGKERRPTTPEVTVTFTKADSLPNKKVNTGPVLLKTAFVPISAHNGIPIRAVILFDEGANQTFASEKFARQTYM